MGTSTKPDINEAHAAPICIKFMIACCTSTNPANEIGIPQWTSEVGEEVREFLLNKGLIFSNHKATERGQAWIRFICSTTLPELEQRWILPERDIESAWEKE